MAKFIHIFGLIILCLAFPIKADDDNDTLPPMITVSGTAEVKVQPDEALVSISVQLNNKTVQDLRNQIDTIAADILSYLKDQGIGENDVQTSYISIQPYYNDTAGDTGDTEPDYYTGDKSMTFLLKNLSKYDSIMSGLYDRGLNSVDGITFQVNDELEPKIEARKKAVENAKKIASAMVEALDARLGNVYSISDNSGGFEPMPVSAPMAANAAADGASAEDSSESSVELSGPSISGGVITFSADVTVSFYILN